MEDSWRFRPIQGNICPTCSTSHFPFCCQPPQFDRNGFGIGGHLHRNPNNPSHQRPFFDPYLDNNRMMIPRPPPLHYDDRLNPIPPMYGNPSDFYKTQRSWHGNHSLEMGSSNQYPQPPLMADSGVFSRDGFHDYGGYMRGEYSESDRIHKRMKFDEMGSGSFAQISAPVGGGDYPSNPKQMSEEDERRLSLIREHGRSAVNSHSGLESRRSEWLPGTLNNKGTNQFHLSGSEQSLDFAQQQLQDKPNGFRIDADQSLYLNMTHSQKLQHSDYGQNNSTLHASPQSHGHSNVQTGSPNLMNHNVQSQASSAREQSFLTGQKDDVCHQPNVPRRAPYPISQPSSEEYHVHDFQQLQSGKNDPSKDNTYPHLTKWQACVNSHDVHYQGQHNVVNQSFEAQKQGCYLPPFAGNDIASTRQGQITVARPFGTRPPLPPLPPPPFPMEPSGPPPPQPNDTSSVHKPSPSVYPIPSSSVSMPLLNVSARETQSFPPRHPSPEKPRIIDASLLLRRPHRFSRPDYIVIILRGLPGSGKSYLAKMIRDLEVENGGKAPRIHSMDDYFMTEVEKVEERDTSKSSTSVKGKRQITKKVMEYCYEPEMEEAYRLSMLKAFKKNLDEGSFTFIIVDDRNLRVADFAQFWASAKRSGYEVYLLEATYKDPAGCAARNVHGFTSDDIKGMAELWEEAPSLYLQLDVQSLFQGDGLDENGIQEVDMDTEDASCDEHLSGLYDGESLKKKELPVEDYAPEGSFKEGERWDAEENDSTGVKELGKSKWSQDVDEEETEKCVGAKQSSNALSGLIQAYNKGDKTVHWADQVGKTGFSIGGTKKANMLSLVIGPGAGYNLKSNPLLEEDKLGQTAGSSWESSKRTVFQEHLRAERESFRAVFDRRRQRIGLQADDE